MFDNIELSLVWYTIILVSNPVNDRSPAIIASDRLNYHRFDSDIINTTKLSHAIKIKTVDAKHCQMLQVCTSRLTQIYTHARI